MLPPTWQTITENYFKYLLNEVLHLCESGIATVSSFLCDCSRTFLKINSFLFFMESVPQNALVVSHQPTQARACWLSTSWRIMSQDCHVWSTTKTDSVDFVLERVDWVKEKIAVYSCMNFIMPTPPPNKPIMSRCRRWDTYTFTPVTTQVIIGRCHTYSGNAVIRQHHDSYLGF